MRPGDAALRRYARAIELEWSERAERPIVLSPRDFRLLADWCGRDVPLDLVRDALRELCGRRRDGAAPRRLSAIAALVEESWRTVVEGRTATPVSAPVKTTGDDYRAVDAWRQRAASTSTPAALRARLEELLHDLDTGAELATIDEQLDRALESTVSPSIESELRRALEERLAPHRERLEPAEFEAAIARGLRAGRRRATGLPRLSGAEGEC